MYPRLRRFILRTGILISSIAFAIVNATANNVDFHDIDDNVLQAVVQEEAIIPSSSSSSPSEQHIVYPVQVLGTEQCDQLPDKRRCRWLESGPDVWIPSDSLPLSSNSSNSTSSTNENSKSNSNSDRNKNTSTSTLDGMFRRIIRMYQDNEKYKSKMTIVSSPDTMPPKTYWDYSLPKDHEDEDEDEVDIDIDDDDDDDDGEESDISIINDPYDLHVGDGGPWIITIDDFLYIEEADRLIELGKWEGFERSTIIDEDDDEYVDVDEDEDEDTSENPDGRTSSTAWCQSWTCQNDDILQDVIDRIYELIQINVLYAEDLQLLQYEIGQYYGAHHDFYYIDDHDQWNQDGGRILTVFLYLNDVADGGGTSFPRLNVTVTPKLGRVVIWPSVLDHDPRNIDWRTEHEALAVKDGVKYGANLWFHLKPTRKSYFNYECDKPTKNKNTNTNHNFVGDSTRNMYGGYNDNDDEGDGDEETNSMFDKFGLQLEEDDDNVTTEL
mmetsp:Transcript_1641/g.1831  ORF Transcript_1641/g.1831 Transcript_1641/m.1831 type:complete len:496 (+) Transcript_1641:84-1571(+)